MLNKTLIIECHFIEIHNTASNVMKIFPTTSLHNEKHLSDNRYKNKDISVLFVAVKNSKHMWHGRIFVRILSNSVCYIEISAGVSIYERQLEKIL